jgi:hypothetical protein
MYGRNELPVIFLAADVNTLPITSRKPHLYSIYFAKLPEFTLWKLRPERPNGWNLWRFIDNRSFLTFRPLVADRHPLNPDQSRELWRVLLPVIAFRDPLHDHHHQALPGSSPLASSAE